MMARNHGYVYYEMDCAMNLTNPYPPLDVSNPTMEGLRGRSVKVIALTLVKFNLFLEGIAGNILN